MWSKPPEVHKILFMSKPILLNCFAAMYYYPRSYSLKLATGYSFESPDRKPIIEIPALENIYIQFKLANNVARLQNCGITYTHLVSNQG